MAHRPCAMDVKQKSNEPEVRGKRTDDTASSNHIFALQSTINDHRTVIDDHRRMINYLINNTVNITHLNEYYAEKHSNTSPLWKSWRDVLLLLLVFICLGLMVYLLVIRFRPFHLLTSAIIRQHENKQQRQQQKQNKIVPQKHPLPNLDSPIIATIARDHLRYHHDSNLSF